MNWGLTPNPSIERTHNGEAQLCASATPSAPLRSAHVERYASRFSVR